MTAKILINPFEKYNEVPMLAAGGLATILCCWIGYMLNINFEGAIDIHIGGGNVPLAKPFLENSINIACLFMFIYLAAVMVNKKTRMIDILNTILVARILYCVIPLIGILIPDNDNMSSIPWLELSFTQIVLALVQFILVIFMIGLVVWHFTLLYKGFKIAANAKNIKHIIIFIVSILLAEILSSYLIHLFN